MSDPAIAGIVLAGGRSRRMGTPKAALEWHGSTLLYRAAGLVARAVDGPVVVVVAAGQELPGGLGAVSTPGGGKSAQALPDGVESAEDERDDRGPLQGIATGLAHIGGRAQVVFVSAVDAPLLHPALIRHVLRSLGPEHDVALPRAHGFAQPLAAAYRCAIAPVVEGQIELGLLGTGALLARLRVRELDEAALLADEDVAAHDPELTSLLNLNEPGAYEAARARPGPAITVRLAGRPARALAAATLAEAAAAVRVDLGERTVARLAGQGIVDDPQTPLADGDALTFEPSATRS